jgi:hypothetical protein
MPDVDRPPQAAAAFAAFREGLAAPWLGFRHMCRHPHLWRYGVVPILLNLLITAVVIVLVVVMTTFVAPPIIKRLAYALYPDKFAPHEEQEPKSKQPKPIPATSAV